MDKIQKALIKMGRKDLAQLYYQKISKVEKEVECHIELAELPSELKDGSKISQGFISEVKKDGKPHCDVRIRNQEGKYTLTAKYRPENQEAEMTISKEIFDALWTTVTRKEIKTRYKTKGWEVDALDDGRIFAEYEFDENEKKVSVPEHWKRKG
jgi:hypothetical protein